jgi:L-2,4-diaminobutyric acid acetyltransferase
VTHVEASVTPSNIASNKFFQKLAKNRGAAWTLDDQWMPADDFPKVSASHEREALYRIGPLAEGVVPRLFRPPAIFAHGSMPRASALPCVLNLGTSKGTLKPSSKLAQEQVFGERRSFQIRLVVPGDGANMWQLCKEVGMDENSPYLYNLFCIDYADTCLIAIDEKSQSVVGYMLGYIPPTRQDTYFVWQIGALPNLQGSGLVQHLLDRAVAHCGVTHVEASVTPSNIASNKFFQKFAKYHGVAWTLDEQWMPAEDFPKVSMSHEREALYRIGPLGIDRPSL